MVNKPDFLIIGGQKCGTTWLWKQLEEHPDTDLPKIKEIHYFGSSELYSKGEDWYYKHFTDIDGSKVTGEASTSYFFDWVPFWYNKSTEIEYDKSLPSIPELITSKFPDIKIIVMLRNPVRRAISAYYHVLRRVVKKREWFDEGLSPMLGLKKTALNFPKKRILEYGYYSKYLELWFNHVPRNRFKVFIFEEDVVRKPEETIKSLYEFLGLDQSFRPPAVKKPVHKSWTWSRILAIYYTPMILRSVVDRNIGRLLDKNQPFERWALSQKDFDFLHDVYMDEKGKLEHLLERKLDCWNT